MTTVQQDRGELTPADVNLQASAIAVLVEKIARLSQAEKDDLMAVVMEITECEAAEDLDDIQQTLREILFPQLAGRLLERNEIRAPSDAARNAVRKRGAEIAARLSRLRAAANLTQEQLAEKSGLPQSHISRLESAQHSPSLKTVKKLAKALDVSIGELDPAQR